MTVEVKIGVQYAAREIVVESSQTPEAVEELIIAAVKAGGRLTTPGSTRSHLLADSKSNGLTSWSPT